MAIRESENLQLQSQLRFILAVIDGCNESDRAVLQMLESGSRPQNIQMFYAHDQAVHPMPAGHLQVMFQYLEDLLGLDDSTSKEYGEHVKAGGHVLLANIYCDSEAETVASILGRTQSHDGRVLGYGQTARPLPFTA